MIPSVCLGYLYTSMKNFLKYHLPFLAYAILILCVSSIPNLRTPQIRYFAFDKLAHLTEYALFSLLCIRSLRHWMRKGHLSHAYLVTMAILILFALLDEWIQSYVPGRHSDKADYLTDILSGGGIVLIHWMFHRRRETVPK